MPPASVSAHACEPVSAMSTKVAVVVTGVGAVVGVPLSMEPLPSAPCDAEPQQCAVPLSSRPHVVARPVTIFSQTRSPTTATGNGSFSVAPLPSWPAKLAPQHQPAPASSIAHVCEPPTLTDVNT